MILLYFLLIFIPSILSVHLYQNESLAIDESLGIKAKARPSIGSSRPSVNDLSAPGGASAMKEFGLNIGAGMSANMGGALLGAGMTLLKGPLESVGLGAIVDIGCALGFPSSCGDPGPSNQDVIDAVDAVGRSVTQVDAKVNAIKGTLGDMDRVMRAKFKEFTTTFGNLKAGQTTLKRKLGENFRAIEKGFKVTSQQIKRLSEKMTSLIANVMLQDRIRDCETSRNTLNSLFTDYQEFIEETARDAEENHELVVHDINTFYDMVRGGGHWASTAVKMQMNELGSCLMDVAYIEGSESFFQIYARKLVIDRPNKPTDNLLALAVAYEYFMGTLDEADAVLFLVTMDEFRWRPQERIGEKRLFDRTRRSYQAVARQQFDRFGIAENFWEAVQYIITNAKSILQCPAHVQHWLMFDDLEKGIYRTGVDCRNDVKYSHRERYSRRYTHGPNCFFYCLNHEYYQSVSANCQEFQSFTQLYRSLLDRWPSLWKYSSRPWHAFLDGKVIRRSRGCNRFFGTKKDWYKEACHDKPQDITVISGDMFYYTRLISVEDCHEIPVFEDGHGEHPPWY